MTATPTDANRPPSTADGLALFSGLRPIILGIGLFTAAVNVLMLTGALYMLQVYDRVIPSRSFATLAALSVLAATLFITQGILDAARGRLLIRLGALIDERLAGPLFAERLRARATSGLMPEPSASLRDLDQLRGFLSTPGPAVLFDLPWIPLYVGLCFLLHPWLGVTALAGGVIIVGLTLAAEWRAGSMARQASKLSGLRGGFIERTREAAEELVGLGMAARLSEVFARHNRESRDAHMRLALDAANFGAMSRTFRTLLQSALLGVGALLVIDGSASGGVMIAASILMSRALAPVEAAIAHWKNFIGARDAWRRLRVQPAVTAPATAKTVLAAPKSELDVRDLAVLAPGTRQPLLQGITLKLAAGDALGVIGPSGSGKSTLARALANIWPVAAGHIRLDGAKLDHWDPDRLGGMVGYLPQEVSLLEGTVAQNIARFLPKARSEDIIAAARTAGVHDMVLKLPKGYDTELSAGAAVLSVGQRQRLALARALFADPFLIVLDEPNAHLDSEGEAALVAAVQAARARGAIVVVIAHRISALKATTHVLALQQGRAGAFGPRDEVLRKLVHAVPNPAALAGDEGPARQMARVP